MIEVVSERGYPETRVVDVIGVAGVSRKTFYELFTSKEDCFLATYDVLLGNLLGDTARGFESKPGAPWAERIAAGLGALLEAPRRAPRRGPLRDRRGAGRRARRRWPAATPRCASSPASSRPGGRRPRSSCPASPRSRSPAGSTSCSTARSCTARRRACPSRLPDLMFWIVLPFLGPERAAEERERVAALAERPRTEKGGLSAALLFPLIRPESRRPRRSRGQPFGVQGRITAPFALVPSLKTASPWASMLPVGAFGESGSPSC